MKYFRTLWNKLKASLGSGVLDKLLIVDSEFCMNEIVEKSLGRAKSTIEKAHKRFCEQENNNFIELNSNYFHKDYCKECDITTCKEHSNIFQKLKNIKKPVLYWFELESSDRNVAIREKYECYVRGIKGKYTDPNYRNTASFKKSFSNESTTLYVGKVQTYFWGRLVTHLGYSLSEKTASMQLFHWYNTTKFGNLKVKYIVFDNKTKLYLVS